MKPHLFASLALTLAATAASASETPYRVVQTFHPGGDGAWDYVTVDAKHHRLFLSRATHTQVLDAATGAQLADIPGQKHNHGIALVPSAGRGFISDGADASVTIFDLKTYGVLGKVAAQPDADGIIYDPASDRVLVVCGDAASVVPISPQVDPVAGHADPAIDLGGKPEFLAADGRGRVFINLVDKNLVAVVDTKAMKVVAKWPTAPGGSPVGMAIDRRHHRLFVGCRKPQKLLVMSADDGSILADLPIGNGNDATQFDGDIFASCHDGTLSVAREVAAGKFEIVQVVPTRFGARTMGVDTHTHTLYLPTAEFPPGSETQRRPTAIPSTFMVLAVKRG